MSFTQFVIFYAKGSRFPNQPRFLALKDVLVREFGTSSPHVLSMKLNKMRKKK